MRILITLLILVSLLVPPVPLEAKSLVEKTLQSVAHITGITTDEYGGSKYVYGCTAFAIDVRKFITDEHCVGIEMKVDGHLAVPLKLDAKLDLAIIVADYSLPALKFRRKPLTYLEDVTAFGYGYSWKNPVVTAHKVIMTKFTPEEAIYPGTWFLGGFIGGMSGGPIVDKDGKVVGIVQRGNSQVGYGVDVETILDFLNSK